MVDEVCQSLSGLPDLFNLLLDYYFKFYFLIIISGKNISRFAGGVSLNVLIYSRHSS